MESPETRYAVRPDGVNIAYQVAGEGELRIAVCLGFISHLDLQWALPDPAHFFERLGSFAQFVVFDKAGTGLSDPIDHVATLEERVADIEAVVAAAEFDRFVLLGESEGGPSSMLFAATHPESVDALVLYGSIARGPLTVDDPAAWGYSADYAARAAEMVEHWGQGHSMDMFMPSQASPAARRAMGTFERASVSPSMARAVLESAARLDITDVATSLSLPTLVLHRRDDHAVPVEAGRYLASTVPGCEYVELEGVDHAYSTDPDQILDEVERFLTGAAKTRRADRVLATVLFTDIVDSTRKAAELGDAAWRGLLQRHDALIRKLVAENDGRLIKSLGDGAFAEFPGPARAIACAREAVTNAHEELGVQLRAGVHTGECEQLGDDLGGIGVHIGARVAAAAAAEQVLVSSTVKDLVVGSGFEFADCGERELKGVPGRWRLYALAGNGDRAGVDGPQRHMRLGDRATVAVARRAPGAMRALARLAGPRPERGESDVDRSRT
jgi:class 3 adenylate cyclase